MGNIVVIYHSTYGHTKQQAEAVARGAQSVATVRVQLYSVEEAAQRLDELDAAAAIIFGCPTDMGRLSADMKAFIETTSKKWFTLAWKNKIAGAFTNSASFLGDKLNTPVGLLINAMQHGMIFVGLGLVPSANHPEAMTETSGPGSDAPNRVGSSIGLMAPRFQVAPPVAPSHCVLETAEIYGRRVAEITQQFMRGRIA